MTFLNVSLAYLGKWYSLNQQVCLLCLQQNMNLRINHLNINIKYLTTTCFPVSPQCKIFYVGDEYRSTGRNVSTNLQILAGILSVFITPKFVLLVKSERKKQTNLFCNQNGG